MADRSSCVKRWIRRRRFSWIIQSRGEVCRSYSVFCHRSKRRNYIRSTHEGLCVDSLLRERLVEHVDVLSFRNMLLQTKWARYVYLYTHARAYRSMCAKEEERGIGVSLVEHVCFDTGRNEEHNRHTHVFAFVAFIDDVYQFFPDILIEATITLSCRQTRRLRMFFHRSHVRFICVKLQKSTMIEDEYRLLSLPSIQPEHSSSVRIECSSSFRPHCSRTRRLTDVRATADALRQSIRVGMRQSTDRRSILCRLIANDDDRDECDRIERGSREWNEWNVSEDWNNEDEQRPGRQADRNFEKDEDEDGSDVHWELNYSRRDPWKDGADNLGYSSSTGFDIETDWKRHSILTCKSPMAFECSITMEEVHLEWLIERCHSRQSARLVGDLRPSSVDESKRDIVVDRDSPYAWHGHRYPLRYPLVLNRSHRQLIPLAEHCVTNACRSVLSMFGWMDWPDVHEGTKQESSPCPSDVLQWNRNHQHDSYWCESVWKFVDDPVNQMGKTKHWEDESSFPWQSNRSINIQRARNAFPTSITEIDFFSLSLEGKKGNSRRQMSSLPRTNRD